MSLALLANKAEGHRGLLIGEPQAIVLPGQRPIFTYVCPVRLPPGCMARPGRIRWRIGSGSAMTQDAARQICLLEAIERYSLQYREDDPREIESTGLCASEKRMADAHDLLLGHPGRPPDLAPVDSRGCAAGASLADAAVRGLLELVEHEMTAAWHSGRSGFAAIARAEGDTAIAAINRWLASQGRKIRMLGMRHASGAFIVIAICTHRDGSRAAIGSAAGTDLGQTQLHACLEAAVLSFNLAAMELSEPDEATMAPGDRRTLAIYRGEIPLPKMADEEPTGQRTATANPFDGLKPEAVLHRLIRASGMKIAIFDLTRPEASIPVARVQGLA